DSLIPDSPNQPYDAHTVIAHVLDDMEFLEVHAAFAPNILVGFGRVEGATVGVVANQPMHLAGVLDIDASEKAARFVRTRDAVNILYRRGLADAADPEVLRVQRVTEYEDTLANPYIAAERGYVDTVIRPAETRSHVIRALRALRTKRQILPPKKHGNIPL